MANDKTNSVPIDVVFDMKASGMSSNQIIDNLQKMGYSVNHIFDAMKMSDENYENPGVAMNFENFGTNMPPPPMPSQQAYPQPSFEQQMSSSFSGTGRAETEEIIESIMQEKWADMIENIKKIGKWKDEIDARFARVEQEIKNIKENFTSLQNAVFGKVSQYDKDINEVGTEIKAMEKVFQKVLPDLTSNVNELSSIVKKIKK